MSKPLIRQAEWARSHGFTRQYVNALVKSHKIRLVKGKVDPADADRRLSAFQDPLKQAVKASAAQHRRPAAPETSGPRSQHVEGSYAQEPGLPDQLLRARIKREREEGTLKEIERKKRQGGLIDAQEAKAASQARANAEREAFLAWPRRNVADMAIDLGVEERLLLQVLQKYIRQHLTERSSQPLKQMQLR